MTPYQVTLDPQTLQRLFSGDSHLGQLLEAVLNHVLEAQVAEQLHAEPYERTEQRQGYRNGSKPRRLTTRVGRLVLRVPQVRDGVFSTELFARSQRSEQALILTLMEMVVNGVSTRHRWRASPRSCAARASRNQPSPTSAKAWIRWSRRGTSGT